MFPAIVDISSSNARYQFGTIPDRHPEPFGPRPVDARLAPYVGNEGHVAAVRHDMRMGLFSGSTEPNYVTIGSQPFRCMFCQGDRFWYRSVQMNTGGMEFFNLGWANQKSHGLICAACGYVHEFMGDNVQLWEKNTSE